MNALILLSMTAAPALAGAELGGMARELASAARAAGMQRVAVTGFDPANGRDDGTGAAISERLTVALARTRRVQAVERRLLPRLMEEHALGRSGATSSAHRLGRVLPVDGLITGTWIPAPGGVRLLARLVQVESGLIVGASEMELELDSPPSLISLDPFSVPVPVLSAPFPGEEAEPSLAALRDAPASPAGSCEDAADRVDALEESVLELKARYWAARLRAGVDGRSIRSNPGSTITDPLLKRRFYERLKAWHASAEVPPLTPVEVRRFVQADGAAFALHRDCSL